MDKQKAVEMAYQIATLTHPGEEVMELLASLPFERILELFLVLRQSSKPIKSPLNFLRRAIDENWTPETAPTAVNRKMQNVTEELYMRRGLTREEARERMKQW
jgi:hypothetical protein